MALKTARSSLYFIDPDADEVVQVGCVTSITGIEASRDQLDSSCLEEDARSFEAGVANPGTASFTINFDPADASHIKVYDLWRLGTNVQWALGLSDGPPAPAALVPPTYASDGAFDLPDTRSWVVFEAYVANVPLDLALNALVTANVSVQLSGFPSVFPKTAT